ncbi:ferrous iron transport protein B [Anaerocolumna cellulosilytica]|uniref:Ferrous iron transport protein B n=1 Tax=Anaerocolumna cellulosilytica TaxID=433286 RepID=A0A6S6R3V3_9FIRM|nr:ferrous iron transport protein B [Anaerocolumna cellulosilytica]MBB5194059.1 ferrous iron transport protein B [Anaerocolumna cellulosilytica]BCJ94727.1 ferrous iron transport protein B [Anaerocolumna cellulosilytica]
MNYSIALAGNPNSGKTTLFNELTGSKQHVGNWPGVTVDKKEGTYRKNKEITILDLPGTYSLSPYSAEEIVARDYIVKEKPHAVINIVDATSIERNLYLTLQILETQIPTVIALNMMDEVEARGDIIDINKLSKLLGVKVVPIVARSGRGLKELMEVAVDVAKAAKKPEVLDLFDDNISSAVSKIEELLDDAKAEERLWKAIKILEGDEIVTNSLSEPVKVSAEKVVKEAEKHADGDTEAKIADLRYQFISKTVKVAVKKKNTGHVETTSDKLDKILTNRILAIPLFAGIMYLIFAITFGESPIGVGVWLQTIVTDFWDGPLTTAIEEFLVNAGAADWALSLVIDGILAGLGGIISFLPQILVLFLLLSFMEDSGYMARVAFVMDRIFRRFGLSGKSFIPLLMGFGCSVPALMASRTLENEKDRRLTMMITPFMSCGAKLPIYLMFAATLFPNDNQTLVVYSIYFLGLAVAILSGIILSKTLFKGDISNFIMELPQYRIPTLRSVLIHAWDKLKGFAIKAGTVIFASTVLIWLLSNFNFSGMVDMEDSFLASIGNTFAFIFAPLGFGNWRATVGTFTGFIAKENIVSTFGVLFGASEDVATAAAEGAGALPGVTEIFTKVSAYSYMAFNLLCMPCFAAVGAIRREMGSLKWTLRTVGFQMLTAWVVAFLVYNIGNLIF